MIKRKLLYGVASFCFIAVILLQYANMNLLKPLYRGIVQVELNYKVTAQSRQKTLKGIETVTGYSYEARMSRIRVFQCTQNTKPNIKNGEWQQPESTNLFLKSAFLDKRIRKAHPERHLFVRILAMNEGTLEYALYCQFWVSFGANANVSVEAQPTEIWHNSWDQQPRNRIYKPYLISCKVPRKVQQFLNVSNLQVTVSKTPCQTGDKTSVDVIGAPISDGNEQENSSRWFAVCVKPLDFQNDISVRLVEWVELQFMLGADHIDFYIFRVHPQVEKVLRFYESKGNVSLYTATLPGKQPNFSPERTTFLQRNIWQKRRDELLPYNECFYRHLNTHRYVIPLDIDEVIVPKLHETWNQLFASNTIKQLIAGSKAASFSVRNAYFFEQFSHDMDKRTPEKLHTLSNVYRTMNFSEPGQSVKSFISTQEPLLIFNHYALMSISASVQRSVDMPLELVQMNHYKDSCPSMMATQCKDILQSKVKDTIILKYKVMLEDRVATVLQQLGYN